MCIIIMFNMYLKIIVYHINVCYREVESYPFKIVLFFVAKAPVCSFQYFCLFYKVNTRFCCCVDGGDINFIFTHSACFHNVV